MSKIKALVKSCKIELVNENIYESIEFIFDNNEERDLFLEKIASNFINEE